MSDVADKVAELEANIVALEETIEEQQADLHSLATKNEDLETEIDKLEGALEECSSLADSIIDECDRLKLIWKGFR